MRNKQRHGCLTAWLIYLMVAYSIVSFVFFFGTVKLPNESSENTVLIIGSIGVLNILFCYLILKWVKLGFWGILFTNIAMIIIQITNGYNLSQPILGIFCTVTLFGLLQIKKKNVSGWDNLE